MSLKVAFFLVILCLVCGVVAQASRQACDVCNCTNSRPRFVNCTLKGLTELPRGIPNDTVVLWVFQSLTATPPSAWATIFSISPVKSSLRSTWPWELPLNLVFHMKHMPQPLSNGFTTRSYLLLRPIRTLCSPYLSCHYQPSLWLWPTLLGLLL